jgi:hypothetical protein
MVSQLLKPEYEVSFFVALSEFVLLTNNLITIMD